MNRRTRSATRAPAGWPYSESPCRHPACEPAHPTLRIGREARSGIRCRRSGDAQCLEVGIQAVLAELFEDVGQLGAAGVGAPLQDPPLESLVPVAAVIGGRVVEGLADGIA